MKTIVKEEKYEFLYPGDVWSGIFGKDYENKIEDFLKKTIAEASFKDIKIIYNNIYTFLEWTPKNSPMAYNLILEDIVENKQKCLSYVTGCPFLEGKKQKIEITCIQGHKEHNRLEGYMGLSFIPHAQIMMAYNPLYALQYPVFHHMKPNKSGKYKVNVCVAGLALSIKKTPRKIIKVDKGGYYETLLKEFLEKHSDKSQEDFPYVKVDASHMSALFVKDIKDECEFVSDIYSIKKFKFNNIDFYRLEIEVLRDIKTNKGMKVYLYVNKELLRKYEPKVKDNIHGVMQLSAYIDEKECIKIIEESKESAEFITENGRVEYKFEVPANQDEFSNGLAFRDSLAAQNGMLYLYRGELVSMFTPQTKIPVDYIFTDLCGNILKIARNVKPLSRKRHRCFNTTAVIEINKGEADKLGIKEGDILLNKHLIPNYDYGKLTVTNANQYYRYDKDLYAEKDGILYFYSYKSHAWYNANSTGQTQNLEDRIANRLNMGIEKVVISASEAEHLMNMYENELRSDYAKTLKRFYRLREKIFYSHDEINDTYQLYTFKDGWIDTDWIYNTHRVFAINQTIALRVTSSEIEKLIKKYQKDAPKNNYQVDFDILTRMHFYDDGDPHNEYYLVLGGTLWCINEKNKTYQTFDNANRKWTDMDWLGDKLEHEVECARHLGKKLDYGEMLEILKKLGNKK